MDLSCFIGPRFILRGIAGARRGLFLVLFLCLAPAPASARSYDDIIDSGVITVAVYRDFPPYSFVDEGQAKGLDVDLARELAAGLGVGLILHWMTPDENVGDDFRNYLWKGNKLGNPDGKRVKADVMMRVPYDRQFSYRRDDVGGLENGLVHMFGPYQKERWMAAINPDKVAKFDTAARLQYHPVGVEIDSIPQVFMTSAFGGRLRNSAHTFHSTEQAFDAMEKGQVDMVLGLASTLQWLQRRSPSTSRLSSIPFPMAGKAEWEIGMAVHTNYRQLAYALEDILGVAISNGKLAALAESYGLEYRVPGIYQMAAK